MGETRCGKCGEMVDAAKAFCPGCGNAIVEEKKRTSVSEFDRLDHTVQLGETMYNQMLSDMGLNASKQPVREAKVIETIKPVAITPEPLPKRGPSFAMIAVIGIAVVTAVVLAVLAVALIVVAYLYSR